MAIATQADASGRITFAAYVSLISALMGSFQFGWNTQVLNGTGPAINAFTGTDPHSALWSFINALFPLGGMLGALVSGNIADRTGRKLYMALNSLFFIAAGVLFFISASIEGHAGCLAVLSVARFLTGLGGGGATVVVPIYVGEIAMRRHRGAFGALCQLACVTGLLATGTMGMQVNEGTEWRWTLGMTAVFGVVSLISSPFILESP
ncbi:SLC2A3, partial [Symbiodinium sp. KB8]